MIFAWAILIQSYCLTAVLIGKLWWANNLWHTFTEQAAAIPTVNPTVGSITLAALVIAIMAIPAVVWTAACTALFGKFGLVISTISIIQIAVMVLV
jgi:hypothetical protein